MVNATHAQSRHLALTTYRRDGRPVTTPVWAVALDGRFYVVMARKARRVRAAGRVRFAPCSKDGRRIMGEWSEGTCRIVKDQEGRHHEALAALRRTHGWQLSVAMLLDRWWRGAWNHVVLELTPRSGKR